MSEVVLVFGAIVFVYFLSYYFGSDKDSKSDRDCHRCVISERRDDNE